jgi:sensor histidine kinase YesM
MSFFSHLSSNSRLFYLAAVIMWMLLGGLFLLQAWFYNISTGQVMDWSRQAPYRLSGYLVWGLFTVPLFHLFQWCQSRFSPLKHFLLQAILLLIVAVLHRLLGTFVEYLVRTWFLAEESGISAFFGMRTIALMGGSLDSGLTYIVLLLLFAGISAVERNQQQQIQLQNIERQLTQSRLDALQSQLQPHFLFNTLNGIVAAIHSAPMQAESMLTQLSRLLRFSLDHGNGNTIPLRAELSILEDYLNIEQARLGERLNYQIEVAETDLNFEVPPLILQPLVENAVRHGIAPINRPGSIKISVSEQAGNLRISIADSGVPVTIIPEEGIGLSNCRARLKALFGEAASLEVSTSDLGGTQAIMNIPILNSEKHSGTTS